MDFSQASASEEVRVKLKGHKSSVLMENFLLTSTPLSKKDIKVEISEVRFVQRSKYFPKSHKRLSFDRRTSLASATSS